MKQGQVMAICCDLFRKPESHIWVVICHPLLFLYSNDKAGVFSIVTNEELVKRIQNGDHAADNMQTLYEKNLPLITQFVKPYAHYEPVEDLLQESYFGLVEAVNHYESSENVLFMTYAAYWIKQVVVRYIERCGSIVKIPGGVRRKISGYKKAVAQLEADRGCVPEDSEVADCLGMPVKEVQRIKVLAQGVTSLSTPLIGNEDLTLADTLQADLRLEDETVDKIYDEYSKNEIWGIVERYTAIHENEMIREYFIENKSMPEIAKEHGLTVAKVRDIKEKGLRRLRMGRAQRELMEKFDAAGAGAYRGSLNKFREHDCTSVVEYMAIKRQEAQEEYERRLRELEETKNMVGKFDSVR